MQALKAVSPEAFAGLSWKRPDNYMHAVGYSMIPVVAGELLKVAACLPLAFVQNSGRWQLVAIMSLQPDSNLLVGPQGQWLADYVPAMLRGYPFTLVKVEDAEGAEGGDEEWVLCTADKGPHLAPAGQGEEFFGSDGKPSPAVQQMMDFLVGIEKSRASTQRGVDALVAANLIVPWELTTNHNGVTSPVPGIYRLDEVAFAALKPRGTLATLQVEGAVPIAYAHFYSREHFNTLRRAIKAQEHLRGVR